jgi:tetratricopeptide (TPR) repeat protein
VIHHLLRVEPDARLLVAATARRGESWEPEALDGLLLGLRMLDRVTEIELARLGREETALIAERLTGRPLAAPDAERLHAETEGNPLFVVETLRAGWRSGGAGPGVSPKVQAVIQHRLGQLTEAARQLADLAATAGREFTTELLERATDMGGEAFVRALDELWRRGIVREHGAHRYDFSHDKIREVAYLALGPARRRRHHLRLARALERIHAGDPGPVSARIAAHYEHAAVTEQAITWYERAAETAQQLYAGSEAIRLLGRALDLLRAGRTTAEGDDRELALLTALLTPVSSVEGWSSARLEEVQRRALELTRALRMGPSPQLLYSLALASLARDDFDAAREYGEQLRARARADGDDAVLVESDYVLGIAAFWQGDLEVARRRFEAAVSGYRPEQRRRHLARFWLDPQVVCLSRLGNTLLFLDEPEAAARARDDALALADGIGHPFSRATALVFAAYMAVETNDTERLREYVGALRTARGDHEIQAIRVSDDLLHAYLGVLDGEPGPGLAAIRAVLADPAGVEHAPGMRSMFVRLLLAACTAARDTRGRLAAAEELLRMGGAARHWEAEAHRVRAECLAELGAPAEAVESELASALAVARRQGGRLVERRALASQRRYRESHGDRADLLPTP